MLADMLAASLDSLMDDQFVKLKKDLWEAAGGGCGRTGPPDDAQRKPKLEKTDPSTWTWANLTTQIPPDNVAVLADMQRYAGKHYIRQVNQPLNLLSMNSECINILPLKTYLNAKDKHDAQVKADTDAMTAARTDIALQQADLAAQRSELDKREKVVSDKLKALKAIAG